ncbi:MAG: glutaredoxin 3 [Alphaproteobacteria bacterium]|nr:glutaredoxin 3 [Alphaproteobacteria bacterium]
MKKITVYGREICPYCVRAVSFLKDNDYDYVYHDLPRGSDLESEVFERSNGMRTVPQVFVGERHIGGYTDLLKAHQDGSLQE